MILVVGSTGFLGSEICRRLSVSGVPVRGLVRSTSAPEKVARLKSLGVETVLGDLRDPASLAAACKGMDAVITTATTTISMQPGDSIPVTDQQGQLDLVEAARRAGVSRYVYLSVPLGTEACPLVTAKRTVEKAVRDSGMNYTILCPGIFMEIWLSPVLGFDFPNAKANILGDGHVMNTYISLGDVAEYAVQSLNNPAAINGLFELGHPQMLTMLEIVRIFEQTGGKSFELQFVPAQALEAQRNAATDPLQISFAAMMHNQAAGGMRLNTYLTEKAFPSMKLTSVQDYAARVPAMG